MGSFQARVRDTLRRTKRWTRRPKTKFNVVALDAARPHFGEVGYPELVHIDPRDLTLVTHEALFEPETKRRLIAPRAPSYVIDGDWDTPLHIQRPGSDTSELFTFEDLDVYQAFAAHFQDGLPWVETEFYARVCREMASGVPKWDCRTPEQFADRLNGFVDSLYEKIKTEGYRSQVELDPDRPSDDIRITVNRHGHPMFLEGRHRLTIAKLLEIPSVPVRIIARHAKWVDFQVEIWERVARSHSKLLDHQIDHFDLDFFPAQHVDERFDLIRSSLGDYAPAGKRLLDIGANWGHMSKQFESLGFRCTAAVRQERDVEYATRIRDANQCSFDVWHGDIFAFERVEEMHAVLALDIFHHFCKTEHDHANLQALLRRMRRLDLMFFQPHRDDQPDQTAYRNYTETEFVDFVSTHTGLNHRQKLGVASDGLPIYKLWR